MFLCGKLLETAAELPFQLQGGFHTANYYESFTLSKEHIR